MRKGNKKKYLVQITLLSICLLGAKKNVYAEEMIQDVRTSGESYELLSTQIADDEKYSDDKIHFISLPENTDAILLESNGRYAMIDSGENYEAQVIHYLQKQGVTNLDFYLGTHAHNDHIGTAEDILKQFPTEKVYLGEYDDSYVWKVENRWNNQECYDNLVKAANETGAGIVQDFSKENDTFEFGDFTIKIYNYDRKVDEDGVRVPVYDENVNSLIVTVTLGNNTAVLTGDATPVSLNEAAKQIQNPAVYKMPHHGYAMNNSRTILEQFNPQIIVQTGVESLLTEDVKDYISSAGVEYYCTVSDSAAVIAEFPQDGESRVSASYIKMEPDNYYRIDDEVYCFDENGCACGGLCTIDGSYYLFDQKTGKMQYGMQMVNGNLMYFDPSSGCAAIRTWKQDESGKYYYFNQDGTAIRNKWEMIGGVNYYFDASGVWIPNAQVEGWIKNSKGWWYRNYDGSYPYSQWRYLEGKWYYFDRYGYMTTGWLSWNGNWYYLNSSGSMATGWVKYKQDWYYMNNSGAMQTEKVVLGNYIYYFNNSGKWISTSEKARWVQDSIGYWYRMENGSWPSNCWKKIDGAWYYFTADGYRYTGWLQKPEGEYYLGNDGKMKTGWVFSDGGWYFMNASGIRCSGELSVDDKEYYLDPDTGRLQTGWFEYQGEMVYSQSSGERLKKAGWNLIDENWYYLKPESFGRITGWQNINGQDYYFDSMGVLLPGEG